MPVRFLFFSPLLRAWLRARGRRVGGGRGSVAGNGEAGVRWPLRGVDSPDPEPPKMWGAVLWVCGYPTGARARVWLCAGSACGVAGGVGRVRAAGLQNRAGSEEVLGMAVGAPRRGTGWQAKALPDSFCASIPAAAECLQARWSPVPLNVPPAPWQRRLSLGIALSPLARLLGVGLSRAHRWSLA